MSTNLINHIRLSPAMFLSGLHRLLYWQFPQALWQGNPHRREIALTFDDGPCPVDTPHLLKVLDKHQVHATFFNIGQKFEAHIDLARDIAKAGHQIGLHGYQHRPFTHKDIPTLRQQLDYFRERIAEVYDCDPLTVRDVRPPYGFFTSTTLNSLIDWGYRPVMWSVVPPHRNQSVQLTLEQVNHQVQAGTILVLHEGWTGSSVAMLTDLIIENLKVAGFRFVTIQQMWQGYSVNSYSYEGQPQILDRSFR